MTGCEGSRISYHKNVIPPLRIYQSANFSSPKLLIAFQRNSLLSSSIYLSICKDKREMELLSGLSIQVLQDTRHSSLMNLGIVAPDLQPLKYLRLQLHMQKHTQRMRLAAYTCWYRSNIYIFYSEHDIRKPRRWGDTQTTSSTGCLR